jgi:uncharacterized membrane protein YidH (DUF202 family)
MTISDLEKDLEFEVLTKWGAISPERLREAETASRARGVSLEKILLTEYGVPKYLLIQALSMHYDCPFIEYDERLPIPRELLDGLDAQVLSGSLWMPVIKCEDGTVVVAANNPESPAVREEAKKYLSAENYEFRVALEEDIRWFIQDFLHAKPGLLIGTERTGLAFWRTTMAQWRTRLACYRTDLANARTGLAFLRWGLGTAAIANTLLKNKNVSNSPYIYIGVLILGLAICSYGLPVYLKVRKSRISPPGNQTIVEVTAATLIFLENYHFIEETGIRPETKGTMLSRMSDFLADHCTILEPSPSSKVRTMFARERNVLAAQRTIAACYRTIYARARTGLAFIRTGFSFLSIGLGLLVYFGVGLFTVIDILLVLAGTLMFIDGILWYMPVRKEQAEIPRSIAYPE